MSAEAEGFTCRQCGEEVKDETADRRGWCKACRRKVVRRAGGFAVVPAVLLAAAYFWMIDYFDLFKSNFLMIWIALGVAIGYVVFKIARRVLFDVIRARTARRPAPAR
jgi:DNA-directed RNA polymerase subunit RPC12/RpoP